MTEKISQPPPPIPRTSPVRVGWVVESLKPFSLTFLTTSFCGWRSVTSQIRYYDVARALGRMDRAFRMERWLPFRRYDIVVFVKVFKGEFLALAERLKASGTRIVFDSNINYYEEWGDYDIPGTRPTPEQKKDVTRMTSLADLVVADSSYLGEVCRKFNSQVVVIPDAVDADLYKPARRREPRDPSRPLRLIWSGIGKKAHHLKLIEEVLISLKDKLSLHLVVSPPSPTDPPSPVIERLRAGMGAKVTLFNYKRYVRALQESDVIISPKILSSAYEMAHTEYKIMLGMAAGLPALASPQPSYMDALEGNEGGWICRTPEEWRDVLQRLIRDRDLCRQAGEKARALAVQRYSVPRIAGLYKQALLGLLTGTP